jgi:hypothetical protein
MLPSSPWVRAARRLMALLALGATFASEARADCAISGTYSTPQSINALCPRDTTAVIGTAASFRTTQPGQTALQATAPFTVTSYGRVDAYPGGTAVALNDGPPSTSIIFENSGSIQSGGGVALQINLVNRGYAAITNTTTGTIFGRGAIYWPRQPGSGAATLLNTGNITTPGIDVPAVDLSGGSATVTNYGTITAPVNGTAIKFGGAYNILNVMSGARIQGKVVWDPPPTEPNAPARQAVVNLKGGVLTSLASFGDNFDLYVSDGGALTADVSFRTAVVASGTFQVGAGTAQSTMTVGTGFIGVPSYHQADAATLSVFLTPSANSKVTTLGSASIAGGLRLNVGTGTFQVGTRYAIVSARGGVSGTFSRVSAVPATVQFSIVYNADSVEAVVIGPQQ